MAMSGAEAGRQETSLPPQSEDADTSSTGGLPVGSDAEGRPSDQASWCRAITRRLNVMIELHT